MIRLYAIKSTLPRLLLQCHRDAAYSRGPLELVLVVHGDVGAHLDAPAWYLEGGWVLCEEPPRRADALRRTRRAVPLHVRQRRDHLRPRQHLVRAWVRVWVRY